MAVIWFLLALGYSVEIFSFWYEHVAKSSVFVGKKVERSSGILASARCLFVTLL